MAGIVEDDRDGIDRQIDQVGEGAFEAGSVAPPQRRDEAMSRNRIARTRRPPDAGGMLFAKQFVFERLSKRRRDGVLDHRLFDIEVFRDIRSEEHTSELQSLMRISYAVFCLKKKITLTKLYTTITEAF